MKELFNITGILRKMPKSLEVKQWDATIFFNGGKHRLSDKQIDKISAIIDTEYKKSKEFLEAQRSNARAAK